MDNAYQHGYERDIKREVSFLSVRDLAGILWINGVWWENVIATYQGIKGSLWGAECTSNDSLGTCAWPTASLLAHFAMQRGLWHF